MDRFLPDPKECWDLGQTAPETPLSDCLDISQAYREAPALARLPLLAIAERTTATVRFLLREEPAGEVPHRDWRRSLDAWRQARRDVRRILFSCDAAVAGQRSAA